MTNAIILEKLGSVGFKGSMQICEAKIHGAMEFTFIRAEMIRLLPLSKLKKFYRFSGQIVLNSIDTYTGNFITVYI